MPSSMIGRSSGGAPYGSSSALSLGQPNLLDGSNQHLLPHHLLEQIPARAAESGDNNGSVGGGVGMIRGRDSMDPLGDEFESRSGSENVDGDAVDNAEQEQDPNQRPRKKRYHRHTQHQIQEMEAFFKECPHPDDKQRKELSRELGLEPLQVKFWFQNKRTQMKNQHERHENSQLRADNDKLRAENMRYKEALSSASCPNCGGPAGAGRGDAHPHLRHPPPVRRQAHRSPVPRCSPSPLAAAPGASAYDVFAGAASVLQAPPDDKQQGVVVELAVAAMEELLRMARLDDPLWATTVDQALALDEEEYARMFIDPRGGLGPKRCGLVSEASRDAAVVIMTPASLVEILMDVNQYAAVFSSIVSRAATLEVLSTGVAGCYDGALQVMSVEFQVPSPLVPTRESYFVRYCKRNADGAWAVVDVSLDGLQGVKCRRRPSGCLIQEAPNGYSKVTWVEHVEAGDDAMVHDLYRPLVNSGPSAPAGGSASSAASASASPAPWPATSQPAISEITNRGAPRSICAVITSSEGRKSMLKLAERMVASFCGGVTASVAHQWTTLSGSGAEDVRVMTRKSVDDPGRPPGIVLNAATSFWLPVPPKRVFDFLRDETSRSEWDILSNGGIVQEMAHIANGRDHGNCVSLLRVNSTNSNQSNMLILQESCTDASGSYVIYAPVDVVAMNVVLNGGDPDYVALLPSGFAILPDGPAGTMHAAAGATGTGGSLLTVAFQILVDSVPTAKLSLGSVATVNSLIACTVERIKPAVISNGGASPPQ
uniref:Homeobox-leucine zipper protein ROC2 n=1 Tax=Aegilops tauschii TaxID=37682 RepID=R7W5E9_AEGTA